MDITGNPENKGQNLIDCHTHILPNMDDGAQDITASAAMMQRLKEQGVGTAILTPHFYTDRESLSAFLHRRETALQKLDPIAKEIEFEIIPACEMYLTDYIFNYQDISPICINAGKYLLTELPFGFSHTIFDKIARLIANLNVVPILAHIERYPFFLYHLENLRRMIDMGCLAQINLNSLIDSGFRQRTILLHAIKDNLVHFIGTDCHNISTRPPDFEKGLNIIQKKVGNAYIDAIIQNTNAII